VRQALSLAIDRDAISKRAFFEISALAQTPHAGGFKFTIQPWGQRPGWTDAALVIKENLAELNVTVEVQPLEDAVAIANLNSGNYEAQFSGNTQDPLSMLNNQFGETGTWTKWMRYSNPQVNKLIGDAGTELDTAKRIEIFHQLQRLAYEDMPLIPISERVVLVGSRVDRKILYEANLLPGFNPRVATVAEYTGAR
jgi:peptide/nickel transport system substrate-binding protein